MDVAVRWMLDPYVLVRGSIPTRNIYGLELGGRCLSERKQEVVDTLTVVAAVFCFDSCIIGLIG